MIAIDTNVLVRLAVDDHPQQAEIVQNLLKTHRTFISRTALLETEWVLRCRYKFPRESLHAFFQLLLQTENIDLEDMHTVKRALDWYLLGADFADALHLAICDKPIMHTFDRSFCKSARDIGIAPNVRVL
ncbi:MAG: type II toxin-antitoxin system VapC family toxin [Methylomonas sp.]|jgi:predicted nucleic-acid-binding protein